jgi:hypothetical protein
VGFSSVMTMASGRLDRTSMKCSLNFDLGFWDDSDKLVLGKRKQSLKRESIDSLGKIDW